MRKFIQLSQEDKNEIVSKAQEYRVDHRKHVDDLISDASGWYAPNGSDLLRPELWKPAHWKWFDRGGE